jgi:Predicted membrane protein, hemolysin III homolog
LVLIAGTYTPITLISLRGPWGWTLFGLIWGLAAVGIVIEATRLRRFRGWLIALYVIMGWAVVAAVKPMMDNVDRGGLWLLLAGGLAYTGGIAFYLWRRLPYNHAIWHLFVLAGSVLHYFAILLYVIPRA